MFLVLFDHGSTMPHHKKNKQITRISLLRACCLAFIVIFMSDLFFDSMILEFFPGISAFMLVFIESLAAVIIALPCLWWFVFKPILVAPLMTEAQLKLQESEARFRKLVEFAPVGIFETDAQGDYIFVNKKWCQIMGLSSEQALGKGWRAVLHPEEKQFVEEEWPWAVTEGWEYKLEYLVINPENSDKWVCGSTTALKGEDGNVCSILGVVIDVTKRYLSEIALRESEDRFRTLFEHSEDAIFLLKMGSCTIIDVNRTAEKLFAYTKEEMIGHDLNMFMPQSDCDDCMLSLCQLAGSETCTMDHFVNRNKDSVEIHLSAQAKVIRLQDENVIFCTMRDITLKLKLEEEASAMQAQMIHSNKMTSLGLLVAGIAHEINNPNNYIMANAQMLYKIWEDLVPMLREEEQKKGDFMLGGLPYSKLEEALPEMITAISDGSRRIRDIIVTLKNYSRKGKSAMGELDINRVVDGAMLLLKHHVKTYTDTFMLELAEETPRVLGSSQQLEQVVINLVMNALQSVTDRKQRLSLKTSFSAKKRAVLLTVTDEGCGIPDEVKDRIMEPFFTTRVDSGGTGLGLSITRSIVLAHQGEIEISSQLGEGTVVTVSLPVSEHYQKGDGQNE